MHLALKKKKSLVKRGSALTGSHTLSVISVFDLFGYFFQTFIKEIPELVGTGFQTGLFRGHNLMLSHK